MHNCARARRPDTARATEALQKKNLRRHQAEPCAHFIIMLQVRVGLLPATVCDTHFLFIYLFIYFFFFLFMRFAIEREHRSKRNTALMDIDYSYAREA